MAKPISKEDLQRLPLRAIVAIAVRAARRVQPLFELPASVDNRDEHILAVDVALKHAELWLARPGQIVWIDLEDPSEVVASAARAAGAASLFASTGAISGSAAANAAYSARAAIRAAYSNRVIDAADYAIRTIDASDGPSAQADYVRLSALAWVDKEFAAETLDATDRGPIGPLWRDGPPEWYVKKKATMDAELARIRGNPPLPEPEGELTVEDVDPERLVIRAEIGEFASLDEAATELSLLIRCLNEAHIAGGGSGLVVDDWEMFVERGVPVTGGRR